MAVVGAPEKQEARPAYVRFKRMAVEDKGASLAQGRSVTKDVDYALITPPYSKDVSEVKVSTWLANAENDVRNDRLPASWLAAWKEAHQAWLNGQEMPLHGTAIRAWGVISPAQQENLIRINILTVEDLAGVNDEGLRRIGMGSLELKHKAVAWLAQLNDKGPLTMEMAQLKTRNAQLEASLNSLTTQVEQLRRLVPSVGTVSVSEPATSTLSISADDILTESEPETPRKRK